MIVKIIQTTKSGLIEGSIKSVSDWVGRELIKKGLAEKHIPSPGESLGAATCQPMPDFDFSIKTPVKGKNKKVAYMATFPLRRDVVLKAIESLINQVDAVVIWANGYSAEESETLAKQFGKELHVFCGDGIDLGCTGKFAFCESWQGYVFTVDDDFVYPEDYVEKLIEAIEVYDRKAIVSLHGRSVIPPVLNYYTDKGDFFRCTKEVPMDEKIDLIGTGVMAFHTETLKTPLSGRDVFSYTNMSDILFSIEMKKREIPMYVMKHAGGWLKALPQKVTIGARTKKDCRLETALINQNWK